MQTVVLKPLQHHGMECIGLYFPISEKIHAALRKTGIAKYSHSNKCWYAPLGKENYNILYFALQGKAEIEQSELHAYLTERKKTNGDMKTVQDSKAAGQKNTTTSNANQLENEKKQVASSNETGIHAVNEHILPAIKQTLILKSYSPSTIKTYLNEVGIFLRTIQKHPADELVPKRLKDYLQYCAEKLNLSENTLHSRMSALKFYYEQVLGREKFFWEIPRPKKQMQLPGFFNQDEIAAIIKAAGNIKHKTMLMLAYSSGLRVSEVVNIRTSLIDSGRMCILIRQAKGEKGQNSKSEPCAFNNVEGVLEKRQSI